MSVRRLAVRAFEGILLVVLVSLVAGAVIGQPVLLSFVETGSMAPTMNAGDGFVAVPSVLAGPPSEGDIVVYRAQELQGGGLTTHRVVGETPEGYITRGDANPFTDQDGGEPPVTRDRIVAHALQVNGEAVVIPYVGVGIGAVQTGMITLQNRIAGLLGVDLLLGSQGVGLVLVGVGVGLFALSVALGRFEGPTRSRERTGRRRGSVDRRSVAVLLLVVVVVPANVAMVVPSGVHEMTLDGDTTAAAGIEPGEPTAWDYEIRNSGFVPVMVVFESDHAEVSIPQYARVLGPGDTRTLSIAVDTPRPGATRTGTVQEYRYLLLLPPGLIEMLHDIHPFVAWGGLNVLLVAAVLALTRVTSGGGPVRVGDSSFVGKFQRRQR